MKKGISISLAIFLFSVFMETGPVQAATGDIQIKLTFVAPFDDLDAHLEGPADNGLTFHVYYLNRISADGRVELDGDGYRGLNDYTETITIMRKNGGFVPGTYRYWVHDYHGEYQGDSLGIVIWMTSVMVEVFRGGVLIETFWPASERMADDNTWNALEMTVSENGDVTLTPGNYMSPAEECDCGRTDVTGISQIECEALVALYNSTNGENWAINTNWNTNTACHTWRGVVVEERTVVGIDLGYNELTGSIPPELGVLSNLVGLLVNDNQLVGSIPSELGSMSNLHVLLAGNNRLSGSIPAELGRLPDLHVFEVPANQLEGDVPSTFLTRHDSHIPTQMNLSRNMLTAAGPSIRDYLNSRQPDWAETQTIPPEDIDVADITATGVRLTWTPIPYTGDGGYYRVYHSDSPGGPYTEAGMTATKHSSGYTVTNLAPATEYFFVIKTFTPANGDQQNELTSRPSEEVSAITLAENGASPIIITDIRGRCGEPVVIPVRIQNAPNSVSAMGFDVIFDPEILMYQGFDKGSLIPENYEFDVSFVPPNIVRCGAHKNGSLYAIPQGATGTVVHLTFEADSDCRSSQIGLDNLKDDIAGWPSLPGFFTRGSDKCGGDTNGDGQITPADALAVFEKFMLICPTSGGTDCNSVCCDVNDDGNCTPADALCVFNAYLGRPNCLD